MQKTLATAEDWRDFVKILLREFAHNYFVHPSGVGAESEDLINNIPEYQSEVY